MVEQGGGEGRGGWELKGNSGNVSCAGADVGLAVYNRMMDTCVAAITCLRAVHADINVV